MKYVPISLVSAEAATDEILSKDHNAWTYALTNEQGYYNFSHLAPGQYLLIINPSC
jgi:protocatechuate 3,4-dioxygenase beta subunit